ncbi:hypothetical protein DL762_007005 [Monosporascus cannonballus]|uniref:Uncharacterized protein n=1 Tax=Monosporascus cannonballus TaxID=155416 RepID=A0ABY0H0E9_9PEZI|nr:hypothetical protein DL763_009570 [Monosporascus cannonballus]RYO81655.1 hypothetical protein DL762_007005 [Monosporascus cannonballus]
MVVPRACRSWSKVVRATLAGDVDRSGAGERVHEGYVAADEDPRAAEAPRLLGPLARVRHRAGVDPAALPERLTRRHERAVTFEQKLWERKINGRLVDWLLELLARKADTSSISCGRSRSGRWGSRTRSRLEDCAPGPDISPEEFEAAGIEAIEEAWANDEEGSVADRNSNGAEEPSEASDDEISDEDMSD